MRRGRPLIPRCRPPNGPGLENAAAAANIPGTGLRVVILVPVGCCRCVVVGFKGWGCSGSETFVTVLRYM